MADLEGDQGLMKSGASSWNRHVKRLQEARKVLARSEEGRTLVANLVREDRVTVRLWAACHALHWPDSTVEARTVLEEIASDPRNGLNQLNADPLRVRPGSPKSRLVIRSELPLSGLTAQPAPATLGSWRPREVWQAELQRECLRLAIVKVDPHRRDVLVGAEPADGAIAEG